MMRVIERCPVALVNAVLRGLRQEAIVRNMISSLEVGPHIDEPDVCQVYPEYYNEIYDAISGQHLDPVLVSKGRQDEMQFLTELGAYTYDAFSTAKQLDATQFQPCGWMFIRETMLTLTSGVAYVWRRPRVVLP